MQAISVCHRYRLWEFEKDIFAMIHSQEDATAMAFVKIKRNRAGSLFFWPTTGISMN
ncbi:MAG: hypothetical protein WB615_00540 [Candidatus Tumulicola sp.]